MIQEVTLDHFTSLPPPTRFEAGTPAMAEAVAMGVACDYLMELGLDNIHAYEQQLGDYLYQELSKVRDVRILGPPPSAPGGRAALCSFHHTKGAHASDISKLMDEVKTCRPSCLNTSVCRKCLKLFMYVVSALFTVAVYHTRDKKWLFWGFVGIRAQRGVAIRSGSHCTQPLHRALGIDISARASLYLYNTTEEVDIFVSGLAEILEALR